MMFRDDREEQMPMAAMGPPLPVLYRHPGGLGTWGPATEATVMRSETWEDWKPGMWFRKRRGHPSKMVLYDQPPPHGTIPTVLAGDFNSTPQMETQGSLQLRCFGHRVLGK